MAPKVISDHFAFSDPKIQDIHPKIKTHLAWSQTSVCTKLQVDSCYSLGGNVPKVIPDFLKCLYPVSNWVLNLLELSSWKQIWPFFTNDFFNLFALSNPTLKMATPKSEGIWPGTTHVSVPNFKLIALELFVFSSRKQIWPLWPKWP